MRKSTEFWLLGYRTTIGKQGFQFIDKANAINIKKAIKIFREDNDFSKLLRKYNLIVARSERWF